MEEDFFELIKTLVKEADEAYAAAKINGSLFFICLHALRNFLILTVNKIPELQEKYYAEVAKLIVKYKDTEDVILQLQSEGKDVNFHTNKQNKLTLELAYLEVDKYTFSATKEKLFGKKAITSEEFPSDNPHRPYFIDKKLFENYYNILIKPITKQDYQDYIDSYNILPIHSKKN